MMTGTLAREEGRYSLYRRAQAGRGTLRFNN